VKVLIAAGTSAVIGQLSKPFTSVVLYGKNLDFRSVFQAGGFPSTHSSSVVAAATAIAFERGFADSIFGLTVVYAGLIMYDAQGVRREVGKHAKVLNKLTANARRSEVMSLKGNESNKALTSEEISEEIAPPLKESIGHTEVEVIAGALFGFLVTLSVYSLM
jgi:acid phosphatase family membrane protein YuiD